LIEPVSCRWVYLRTAEGEKLFRARFFGRSGTLHLPDSGRNGSFERSPRGVVQLRMAEALEVRLYRPGTVLRRSSEGRGPAELSRSSHRRILVLLALSVLLVLFGIVQTAPRSEVKPEVRKPTVIPTAIPIRAPGSARRKPVSKPTPMVKTPDRIRPAVRAVRAALAAGRIERAAALLGNIREQCRGVVPPGLRRIAAEVAYAQCRSAFERGRWGAAGRSCTRAVREGHGTAAGFVAKLDARVRKLFLEGYVMEGRDPESAIRRYREVVATAPQGSVYRGKAAEKLRWIRHPSVD
jgi:hypothetical protein